MGINAAKMTAMPFGTHKGTLMDDVPASYLAWLRDQDWIGKWPEVESYIKAHKASIDKGVADERAAAGDAGDLDDLFD
jgi:protease II